MTDTLSRQGIIDQLKCGKLKLFDVSAAACNDKELVLAALSFNGEQLQFASNSLKNDYDVVHAALSNTPLALEHASGILQGNRDLAYMAVRKNGAAIAFVSPSLQDDWYLAEIAIKQHVSHFICASERLRADAEFAIMALQAAPKDDNGLMAFVFFNMMPELRTSPDFARRCLERGLDVEQMAQWSGEFSMALMQCLLTTGTPPGQQVMSVHHENCLPPERRRASRAAS